MPPGAPGAPPPGFPPGPQGGTGGATVPAPQAGSAAQAQTGVKLALEALQKALPGLPMGSPLHTATLKAVTELSKHMGEQGGGDQAAVIQQLVAKAREAQSAPPQAPASFPGAGGPPPMAQAA